MAADNTRQFTLVGNFTDNITKPLESINKTLGTVLERLERYHTIGLTIKNDFKEVGKTIRELSSDFRDQAGAVSEVTTNLKSYRKEVGKANRANRAGGLRFITAAGKVRAGQTVADAKARGITSVAEARAARISAGRGGGGYGGGGGRSVVGGRLIGDFVAADLITTAIKNGFQAGVALMVKPFQYFGQAFGERIGDELSDVRTAGGLFSISKRQKNPFISSFREAELLTQETNKYLSQLAATLPGPTQEYVQIGKQLADGIASVVATNEKGAIALANVYAKEAGRAEIEGTGPRSQQKAFTELTGELTKLTVLAGYGQAQRGPYGLPQIAERLVTDENVSLGQLQRYAAIFRDPLIKGELERGITDIQKFGKETPERLNAVIQLFRKIVTPELIARYRKTVDGIKEGFYSALFEPESGLFGLGRKLVGVYATARDAFGNILEKEGKQTISLFELIRDIISGFGVPLLEIAQILPEIYEPFQKVGLSLTNLRELSQNFLKTFYGFFEGYKQFADDLERGGLKTLAKTIRASAGPRAAIETVANLLADFGALSDADVLSISKQLQRGDKLGPILKNLFTGFFSSGLWYEIGTAIGEAAGSFLSTLADIGENLLGLGTGGAATPFITGFEKGKGFDAISRLTIIISEAVVRLIIEVGKAIVGAFVKAISSGNLLAAAGIGVAGAGFLSPVAGLLGGFGGGKGGGGGGGGGLFGPTTATKNARRGFAARARLLRQQGKGIGGFGAGLLDFGYSLAGRPGAKAVGGAARGVRAAGKFVPGGAVLGGVASLATSLATGEKFGTAAAGAIGSVLGATAGSFLGPAGTIIGGIAGDWLGREIANRFDPAARAQQEAAQKQLEAAAGQKAAAGLTGLTGTETPFGGVNSQTLESLARLMGVQSNPQIQQLIVALRQRNAAQTTYDKAVETLKEREKTISALLKPGTKGYEDAIKPYRDAVAAAEGVLKDKQVIFDKALSSVPESIRKKLIDRLATMSTTQIEAALARAVDRARVEARLAPGFRQVGYDTYNVPHLNVPPKPNDGTITVNNNITQLPGQNAEDLAAIVVQKISTEVNKQVWY